MTNNEQPDQIVELQTEEAKAVVGGAAPVHTEMRAQPTRGTEPQKMPAPASGEFASVAVKRF